MISRGLRGIRFVNAPEFTAPFNGSCPTRHYTILSLQTTLQQIVGLSYTVVVQGVVSGRPVVSTHEEYTTIVRAIIQYL